MIASHPTRPSVLRRTLAVCLVLVWFAAACTGNEEPSSPTTSGPQTSAPPLTAADAYVYTDPAGIEARLKIDGEEATLTVLNGTGAVLPVPGLYVLDARDGNSVDWKVLDATTIADGERAVFDVRHPAIPEAKHIGLVAMLFGGEDYGAFTPPRPEGEA